MHRLLLSISPHSGHGLENNREENKNKSENSPCVERPLMEKHIQSSHKTRFAKKLREPARQNKQQTKVFHLYVIGWIPVDVIQHQVGGPHQVQAHSACF